MTNEQNPDNKIIIEGVEYTKQELDEYLKELLKPTPAVQIVNPIVQPTGELSFVTDENLYKEIIKYLDKTFPTQESNLSQKLKFENSVMKSSNPYIAVGVDMFLKSINFQYRIATQKDLETNFQMFKGFYEDSGLALRSLEEPNSSQAEHLYKQLKLRNPNIKFPIFINLRDLELDANLNFNLTNESQYKTADCLNWKDGEKYSKVDEFGLPKEINKNSSRRIWTKNSGLAGTYLDGSLDFAAIDKGLSDSADNCKVVLARVGK